MKPLRAVCLCLVLLCMHQSLYAHYRPEQYMKAEKGLETALKDLSVQIATLESVGNAIEKYSAGLGNGSQRFKYTAAIEILRHHAMRAWYNRLLLQNLSDEAISLGQMSTIVRLSIKPLSNGVYQLERVRSEEENKTMDQALNQALEAMRSLLTLYNGALDHLKSAIRSGR